MIKIIAKQLVFVFLLINLALTLQMGMAMADSIQNPLDTLKEVGSGTGLPDFTSSGQHPDAPPDYLQKGVGTVTSPILFALDIFRYAVSGIALVVVIIAAINLISTASDEEATKAKEAMVVGVIGLLVIQFADPLVKKMLFGEQGEAFQDLATSQVYAKESVKQLRGIIGFVQVFVAAVATFVIVIRGFMLITSAGEEEEMTKTKKHILYAIVGIVAVALSEVVVRGVIFPDAGQALPDVSKGNFIIIQLTNYLAGFVSILAFLGLFYGGYSYVVSGGNEEVTEKVKKIILGSLIALLISLGAFALVNTVIKLEPPKEEVTSSSTT
jgi:hypothetical protein